MMEMTEFDVESDEMTDDFAEYKGTKMKKLTQNLTKLGLGLKSESELELLFTAAIGVGGVMLPEIK